MKKLVFVALSALITPAMAFEPDFYAGASGSSWQFKQHDIGTDISLYSINVHGGARLWDYINVEARVGAGLNEGRDSYTATDDMGTADPSDDTTTQERLAIRMDYYASVYFRPEIRNDKASLYGLLGYTSLQFSGDSISSDEEARTQDDLSYGIGVSFKMKENVDLTLEWVKLINAEDFDMRGGTVGFNYWF